MVAVSCSVSAHNVSLVGGAVVWRAQVLLTVQMQLAESTTLNKVLDFELKHLTSQELPALKVCPAVRCSCGSVVFVAVTCVASTSLLPSTGTAVGWL